MSLIEHQMIETSGIREEFTIIQRPKLVNVTAGGSTSEGVAAERGRRGERGVEGRGRQIREEASAGGVSDLAAGGRWGAGAGRRARQCQGRCSGQLTSGDARGTRCRLRGAVESRTPPETHASPFRAAL